jgi:hypothetical protein
VTNFEHAPGESGPVAAPMLEGTSYCCTASLVCLQALGLSRLGYKLLPDWPEAQQLLFALGMLDTKYR